MTGSARPDLQMKRFVCLENSGHLNHPSPTLATCPSRHAAAVKPTPRANSTSTASQRLSPHAVQLSMKRCGQFHDAGCQNLPSLLAPFLPTVALHSILSTNIVPATLRVVRRSLKAASRAHPEKDFGEKRPCFGPLPSSLHWADAVACKKNGPQNCAGGDDTHAAHPQP